ncbi:MerR family transcriptional regulator [Erwinia tracheiphila]|uniref:Transcriptional regulator n=1 Tax=Erwinia tracheiphila TaxID=65700 RepID=A0A0M2KCP2_9GAMM|nr:MerR family transcriptional regulator [Erwinia tracheiphila]EOS96461.1 MerR family transcriptional regulator [Erwinia tracheiphila PSU-1]KKF35037.1 transcriptional regulator [Erwinia tracheiphila]UIA86696.1 MerR family transcriptional regulator [Erwinia tracheiphila]UIA95052.1 MerR family transcriptional regulator [Erwinia tracheiphila]
MALYSIGDVAERCGINPVTLRAWQRRYGLLKPQRTEAGHRQFDDEDIQRIEDIKRWIESGVPVGKVKALIEGDNISNNNEWVAMQDEIIAVLRHVKPAKLRAKIAAACRETPANLLIDHVFIPVRQRLGLVQNTARIMCSLLDGVLIDYVAFCLTGCRKKPGQDALIVGWGTEDRTRIWLEAWRLSQQGWRMDVLAEPLELPRPDLFPGQHVFLFTGKPPTRRQQKQLAQWQEQGLQVAFQGNH